MDAVILAAGYGARLNGLVPRFWKPMMLVDGMPLVATAVDRAISVDCDRVVVVVSPQNAGPMNEILLDDDRLHLVVQRKPTGPGDALLRGLELVRSRSVLVLMGDNVSDMRDVEYVTSSAYLSSNQGRTLEFVGSIGIQSLKATEENQRYTRWRAVGDGTSAWVEKIPYEKGDLTDSLTPMIRAWVGPIVVGREQAIQTLEEEKSKISDPNVELPIGPFLSRLSPRPRLVGVNTVDVGTPESARGVTA